MKAQLKCNDFALNFEVINHLNWCNVYFHDFAKNSSVLLGADTLEIICNRLHFGLQIENLREEYFCKNAEMFWILTLSAPHSVIYGSFTDDLGMKIFCRMDDLKFLPEINLTKQDVESWLQILKDTT
jgi:hypothetical protein